MTILANRALPAPSLWRDYELARLDAERMWADSERLPRTDPRFYPLRMAYYRACRHIDLLFARAYFAEFGRRVYDYDPQEDAA